MNDSAPSKSVNIQFAKPDDLHTKSPDCRGSGCVEVVAFHDYHLRDIECERRTGDAMILRGLLKRFMACRNENGTGWKMSSGALGPDSINKVYLDAKKYLRIETGGRS